MKTAAVLPPVHGVQHGLINEISGNQSEMGYLFPAYGPALRHVGRQCVQGSRSSSEDRLFSRDVEIGVFDVEALRFGSVQMLR